MSNLLFADDSCILNLVKTWNKSRSGKFKYNLRLVWSLRIPNIITQNRWSNKNFLTKKFQM